MPSVLENSDDVARLFQSARGVIAEDHEIITYVDDIYASAFGYSSSSALLGRHISEVISSEDRSRMLAFGRERVKRARAPHAYHFHGKHSDGADLDVAIEVERLELNGRVLIVSRLTAEPSPLSPFSGFTIERLYDDHAPAVFALLIRMLRNEADARDVLQETFLYAWKERSRFSRERGNEAAWLMTIGRSRALDRLRKMKTSRRYESAAGRLVPQFDQIASECVDIDQAKEVLSSLPPEQLAVLQLAYFDELSHSEIAERLSLPLGTVKTRIASGMRTLRARMNVPRDTRFRKAAPYVRRDASEHRGLRTGEEHRL